MTPTFEIGRGRAALLFATVFASGASVMIVEMTAVRTLQPFFGSTNLVWANVIAVVLAALAAGYAAGGSLADLRPSPRLLYGILVAGGALVVAGAALVTPVSGLFLAEGAALDGMIAVSLRGSLGVSLVVFAPPVLLLGAISPFAIRLLARRGVGRAAGRVFAWSTLGSIAGTYAPVLWLVPAIGSRGSILVAGGILLAAGAAGLFAFAGGRRVPIASAVVALLAAGAAALAARDRPPPGRPLPVLSDGYTAVSQREFETPYHYLSLREDVAPDGELWRVLTINDAVSAFHAVRGGDRVMTGIPEYDSYAPLPALLDLMAGDPLRACVVGLAAGRNAIQWRHFWGGIAELRVDGAEIDPVIIDLGREHFDMPGPAEDWLRVRATDGRQFLAALPPATRYDLIVVDAFANDLYVPFHLATREFFELCRRRLEPGGILAMNVYCRDRETELLRAIENTIAAVFGGAVRTRAPRSENQLLLARHGPAPPDVQRLSRSHLEARFGFERVPEREPFFEIGESLFAAARPVVPDPEETILTDDDAPVERLTDRFLAAESAAVGPDAAPARLLAKQDRLLLAALGAWLAVGTAGCLAARFLARRTAAPTATAP